MSDYYRRRRVMIKDGAALMTFFLGFVWSGAFAWPMLADGVDQGDMTRGLAYFLAAVLGSGILAGLVGLETGSVVGGIWERYHRQHRSAYADRRVPAFASLPSLPGPVLTSPVVDPSRRADLRSINYTQDGVYAASYIGLAERARAARYDVRHIRSALAKTVNIGAWDGARLVGAVRVLTDGYVFSAVADIVVDPDYQRLGIGRRLMAEALAAAPDRRLFVEAPPDSTGFFLRAGCERGPTGLVLTTSGDIP
ncbi:MAG: GNAT family N-acetyltransferase [Gemmatimonadota bacterium]|nr:GNAT family N-acetyltransferase [Gemmatimonadota bacterium]